MPWLIFFVGVSLLFCIGGKCLLSHPQHGATQMNVLSWMGLPNTDLSMPWHMAKNYLKEDGFIMFCDAKPTMT
jgi:hypothetical protein